MSPKSAIHCDVNGRAVGSEPKAANAANGLTEDGDEGSGVESHEETADFNSRNDGTGFLDVCSSGD